MDSSSQALNEKEQRIFQALRENPQLEQCFLEMIDISHSPLGTLDKGDDAEDAVIHAIQKTGKVVLEEWCQKKSHQAAEKAQRQPGTHLHVKKKSDGTHR